MNIELFSYITALTTFFEDSHRTVSETIRVPNKRVSTLTVECQGVRVDATGTRDSIPLDTRPALPSPRVADEIGCSSPGAGHS